MRPWNAPKMTAPERTLWQKAADDAKSVNELLYSLLKFSVELRMHPDSMKGLQDGIKAVNTFYEGVVGDLERDKEPRR